MKMIPILARERNEAYREGAAQASMCAYDDAFEQGRQQGFAANSKDNRMFRWLCFIAGTGVGYFTAWCVS